MVRVLPEMDQGRCDDAHTGKQQLRLALETSRVAGRSPEPEIRSARHRGGREDGSPALVHSGV